MEDREAAERGRWRSDEHTQKLAGEYQSRVTMRLNHLLQQCAESTDAQVGLAYGAYAECLNTSRALFGDTPAKPARKAPPVERGTSDDSEKPKEPRREGTAQRRGVRRANLRPTRDIASEEVPGG